MADIPGHHRGRARGRGARPPVPAPRRALPAAGPPLDCSAEGDERDAAAGPTRRSTASCELYSEELAKKPQIVAANKVDLPEARENAEKFAAAMKRKKKKVHIISAATGEGLKALLDEAAKVLYAK